MPKEPGEQGRFLLSLRRSRAAEFRSEIVPYFRYVAQSGFGLAVSAAVFALILGYIHLIQDVPADFPAGWAGAMWMASALVPVPMRSYLRPADPVFLLPMEPYVLGPYLRPALQTALSSGLVRAAAAYALYLPLYIRAPVTEMVAATRPLWLLALAFAALAVWNVRGAWRERQTVNRLPRMLLKSIRYAVTLAASAALLLGSPLPAFGLFAGLLLLVSLAWRLPRHQLLPWDKLIAEESAARRRWYRFLSWFVDVAADDARPVRRGWAARLPDRLPWARSQAWTYLYAKTFARGETFGNLLRWHGLIGVVLAVSSSRTADWTAFSLGVLAAGVQLTELRRAKTSLAAAVLPLQEEEKGAAAAWTARWAGTAGTVLLWLTAVLSQGGQAGLAGWLALAGGIAWSAWLIPGRIAKPLDEEE